MIRFTSCENVLVQGVTLLNSPKFHIIPMTSRRLRLKPEEEYTVYEVDASDEDADILNYDDLDSADDFV